MMMRATGSPRSGLEDRDGLAFGDDVIEPDQNGFQCARGGRGDRDFHLHGLDEAMSSPLPTLAPVSTGSAQTRPATSVTTLISGISLSGTATARNHDRGACTIKGGRP